MRKVLAFLSEVRVELTKVVWPTRRRALNLTLIVIAVSIVMGAFLAAVDFGLTKGVEYSIDTAQKEDNATPAPAANSTTQQIPVKVPATTK